MYRRYAAAIATAAFIAVAGGIEYRAYGISRTSTLIAKLASSGHEIAKGRLGSATIIEFADYQCPYCAEMEQRIHALADRGKLAARLVYHHYPLTDKHRYAFAAAVAAECAGLQGHFLEYHHELFLRQDELGRTSWSTIASDANVPDSALFARCVDSPDAAAAVERDLAVARQLRLRGTPAFIVGRHVYYGSLPNSLLRESGATQIK